MKTKNYYLLTAAMMLVIGANLLSCNNDNDYYIKENVSNQEVRGFFYSSEYEDISNSFDIDVENFMLKEMVVTPYNNKNVNSFIIPISKNGTVIGQVMIFSKRNGEIYRALYEDRSNFTYLDGGSVKILTAQNGYIASVKYTIINAEKVSMTIENVATKNRIKTRAEFPSSDDGWLDCTTGCYSYAKEACDSDNSCEMLCDMVDITGLCTASIAAACAIYCI